MNDAPEEILLQPSDSVCRNLSLNFSQTWPSRPETKDKCADNVHTVLPLFDGVFTH